MSAALPEARSLFRQNAETSTLQACAPQNADEAHGRDRAALAETKRSVEERGARADMNPVRFFFDAAQTSEMAKQIAHEPLDGPDQQRRHGGRSHEVSLGEWQRTFAVNVTTPFLLAQKLASRMSAGVSIVNVLSIAQR